MAVVFVVGGLAHLHHLAGFAALGALVSAFCRPDPYPVRQGRLMVLAAGITASVGAGALLGAAALPFAVDVAAISLLAGAAAYLMWALHIVGPGAVVFVFAAVGAQGAAGDAGDVARLTGMTVGGAVIGVAAAMAPWWLSRRPAANPTVAQRESLTSTLIRAPHAALAVRGLRIACAGALGATVAAGLGFDHPMWAAMGAVATMQGVGYHMTVQRGAQRLLGNIGGAVVAAALLALPATATLQAFEQGRRRAAGHVADRDLDRFAGAQRVVVDGRQRIAALGRGAVGVVEMHLDELAGDEIQRRAVVADEGVMAHGRGQHAARNEFEREVLDGHGNPTKLQQTVAGTAPRGRLY